MPEFPEKISHLWNELKDRKVLRSTTVYVAVGFGLLELIDIISVPLHLTGWVLRIYMILFISGLPIIILISWMFCFTPQGIKRYIKLEPPERVADFVDELLPVDEEQKVHTRPEDTKKQTGWIYGFTSFFVICMVAVLFIFYSGKSAVFMERDWIILADFVNHTGEEIFEHSLNTAFEISIDQSRHVNVLTRSRIQGVLTRIGKQDETKIDEALCREIAMREGVTVYMVPEISRVGDKYILTAKLMDAQNGEILVSEIYYSKGKDQIMSKLDRMSRHMRRYLGESRYKIAGQNKALEKVTTSSLDALKQYSLGIEANSITMDYSSAVTYYENAIRLDSNFTAAKASLGNLLYNNFDQERGKYWLDEAMKSIDNLTEIERLSVLAFYASNVEKNLDKSIEYMRMQIELYPDKMGARNNLAWYLQNRGDYDEAITEYKELIRLDPHLGLPYLGLIDTYLRYLGEIDSAMVWSERLINSAPENGWGYFFRGSCFFGLDDYEQAKADFDKANRFSPGTSLIMYRLAHSYRVLGMYDKAVEVLNSLIQLYEQEGSAYYDLAVNYGLMGRDDKEKEHYQKYRTFVEELEKSKPDEASTYISKGIVLTRLGEKKKGLEAGLKGYEMDSTDHFNFAGFLAVQGRADEALDQLEIALEHGYRHIVWIKMHPDMFVLWDQPRYEHLLNQYFH